MDKSGRRCAEGRGHVDSCSTALASKVLFLIHSEHMSLCRVVLRQNNCGGGGGGWCGGWGGGGQLYPEANVCRHCPMCV